MLYFFQELLLSEDLIKGSELELDLEGYSNLTISDQKKYVKLKKTLNRGKGQNIKFRMSTRLTLFAVYARIKTFSMNEAFYLSFSLEIMTRN